MASLSASITQGCQPTGGLLSLSSVSPASGAGPNLNYTWTVLDSAGTDFGGSFDPGQLPAEVSALANGTYKVRVRAEDLDSSATYTSQLFTFTLACAATGNGLQLDSLAHTDETAATNDGTATVQASGGTAPLTAVVVETGATQAATAGQPVTFTGLAPGTATLRVTDSSPTPEAVEGTVTILAYTAPVTGCTDEYADNYDPAAASDTSPTSCSYTPRWRSAWAPGRVPVRVPALAGQTAAYALADLRIGFRPGHLLAEARPLGAPLRLAATIGPDGFATFRLGPYLQAALGSDDGEGGRRLDLNSPTAFDADLYVGYELRRLTGELLEHGYVLNAAVPDAELDATRPDYNPTLSPFAPFRWPIWPGYDHYLLAYRADIVTGFGLLQQAEAYDLLYDPDDNPAPAYLPCPLNPLPVAWLAPGGGYGYWVFSGRPVLSDEVGEGSSYQEPETGERRYSDRGAARRTITATSGVFKGAGLMEGLRTLWRSPQVWYQPVKDGPWVPVTLESGSFPAGRMGVLKQQVSISFTHAAPEWAQGQ